MSMGIIDSQEPVYRAEHEIDVLEKRIEKLESLLKDVWAAYSEKAESSFHPVWEVDGELVERMRALGLEADDD